MSLIQSLACPNCGYPFPTTIVPGSIIQCAACHSTFSMPATLTPEPDLGNLLLAADMRGPEIPGWKSSSWVKAEFTQYNGIAEWQVTMAPEPNHQTDFLLCTPGILDDFDTCATFRFLSGDEKNYFAGFDLRARSLPPVGLSQQPATDVFWRRRIIWGPRRNAAARVGWNGTDPHYLLRA